MAGSAATGLAITNPLVKYRALIATKAISSDQGQLRLALHLQKLYEQLKDYEPEVEYRQQLEQISRAIGSTKLAGASQTSSAQSSKGELDEPPRRWGGLRDLWAAKERRDSLALTRRLTSHEMAQQLSSPRGLMVHGEVGTGKSMLIDLFADCLPNRKKRRWHFNTFMLETIAKLETFRQATTARAGGSAPLGTKDIEDDYSLLWLARNMIQTSPIVFLDEFQMPDRVASKILTNLMTSFFQLGGVLIATSNRMPEELAKASGIEFAPPPVDPDSRGWRLNFRRSSSSSSGAGLYYGQNEFIRFLEVLKARCHIWEMDSGVDYRRSESNHANAPSQKAGAGDTSTGDDTLLSDAAAEAADDSTATNEEGTSLEVPAYYCLKDVDSTTADGKSFSVTMQELAQTVFTERLDFIPAAVNVYGRTVVVPRTCNGIADWTFAELCNSTLGPADYITLASNYHTFIIRDIPVLTWLMKNEARRFITLLDALYECRCKLSVCDAAAGPDEIFFPENDKSAGTSDADNDSVYSETISEVYQDATAPFRPNILTQNPNYTEPDAEPDYTHARLAGILKDDALEDEPPHRARTAFARSFGRSDAEIERQPIDPDEDRASRNVRGPDFGKTSAFTGEDEMFAYRRAQSRLWELCGRRWWARDEPDWHRPLPLEARQWEHKPTIPGDVVPLGRRPVQSDGTSDVHIGASVVDESRNEKLFRHGASPFRTTEDPPPRFGWTHAWGMMRWGKKAGVWGQGVDGLAERKK